MRIVIIGPTNKSNLYRYGQLKKEKLSKYFDEIAKILTKYSDFLYIIPDNTVAMEIAKRYKKQGGHHVIGVIPSEKDARRYIKKYFKFCDSVKTLKGGWTFLITHLCLEGNVVLCCGISPGVMVELGYIKYHQRYYKHTKLVLVDERSVSCFPPEIKNEIKNLIMFKNNKQLEKILSDLK